MMRKSIITLQLYIYQTKGATAIEYGLIAAGIALAISGSVFFFGDAMYNMLYKDLPAALNK